MSQLVLTVLEAAGLFLTVLDAGDFFHTASIEALDHIY